MQPRPAMQSSHMTATTTEFLTSALFAFLITRGFSSMLLTGFIRTVNYFETFYFPY